MYYKLASKQIRKLKPAEDFIILNTMNSNEFTLRIYDIWGAKIYEEIYSSSGDNVRISTNELSNGMYFVHVISKGETETRKFCVVR